MKTIFKIVFFTRTSYSTKEGKHPVDIRIYLNGDRTKLGATGQFVSPKTWDSKKGRATGRSAEAIKVNCELDRIEADLRHIFRVHEFDPDLSLDLIRGEYLGETKKKLSLMEFFDEFLKRVESEVGITRQSASLQKFNVLKKHFVAFLKSRYNRKDIGMTELSYRIISDLENYLLTDGKCQHNTVMRMMGNFKTITIRAFKLGLMERDPFADYKIHFAKKDRGFLTDEELKAIMEKPLNVDRLEKVRDIFVFSCFTGLAYIDVAQLTRDNIKVIDGKEWIFTSRQKTNVPSNILLFDVAKQIIKKYEGTDPHGRLLPLLTNQRCNSYLKEIADICGIKKNLTFHIGRHTFATLALSKGVPIETVSKMLGHTKIATTQIYARITNKKIEQDMMALESQLGGFNVDTIASSTGVAERTAPSRFDEPVPPTPSASKTNKSSVATKPPRAAQRKRTVKLATAK